MLLYLSFVYCKLSPLFLYLAFLLIAQDRLSFAPTAHRPSMAHSHSHDGGHSHSHGQPNEHGHTHEVLDHPGKFASRDLPTYEGRNWKERAFTVGIGGPVYFSLGFPIGCFN